MNIETRLKLLIAPECVARLRRHPLLKTPLRLRTIKFTSLYYDTPGLDLKSKNIVLQLKKESARWTQSISVGKMNLAGLHTSSVWETPLARNVFDFTRLDNPFLAGVFGAADFRLGLHSLFTAEFMRKTVPLEFAGSRIEYCFDQGELRSGDQFEGICEIGLGLQSGSPASLFEFALELQKTIPLKLAHTSQAERGYALFMGQASNRVGTAVSIAINKKMSVSAACKEIVCGCLRQMQDNTAGFAAREADSEYLHQMRVALRRMRSSFNVFSGMVGKAAFSSLLPELRWLACELGPARNWDVFMLETLPPVLDALSAEPGLIALQQAAEHKRQQSLNRAIAAVASQRYQALLLKLGAALNDASWPDYGAAQHVSVLNFANRVLDKRYQNFRHRGENLQTLPRDKLHALRIAGKKLRYAAEFFAPLYPRRAARSYLGAMSALQDVLGSINDAATARHLLREFFGTDPEAVRLIRGWVACRSRQRIAELRPLWKRFKSKAPFWE
ncbi:MAG: CYTH and CHAD domain-containing protein [Sulfuriferula sp.]